MGKWSGPDFLDLGTSWRRVVSFTPRPPYPREKSPRCPLDRRWVDPRVGLDDVEKRNSWPYRDSNSDSSVVQPVASRYNDWAIPAPACMSTLYILSAIEYSASPVYSYFPCRQECLPAQLTLCQCRRFLWFDHLRLCLLLMRNWKLRIHNYMFSSW
jgi:hypothetical protein